MLLHGRGCLRGTAAQEGRHDFPMFFQGQVLGAVAIADGLANDLYKGLIAGDLLREAAIWAGRGDQAVQLTIRIPGPLRPPERAGTRGEQFRQSLLQMLQLLTGKRGAGEAGGFRFEQGADFVDLLDLAGTEGRDDGAAVGTKFHQPDSGELLERLPYRGTAHVEKGGEIFLTQAIARFPLATEDAEEHAADEVRLEDRFARGRALAEGGGGSLGDQSWKSGEDG